MSIEIKIKTWKCNCGFGQDFEPTSELMDLHYNQSHPSLFKNIKENQCPSCLVGVLNAVINDSEAFLVTVDDEDDIETVQKFRDIEHK